MTEESLLRTLMTERVKILAYVNAIARHPDLAEDIFQDICVLALTKRGTLKDESHLLLWLRKTARFETLNRLRKRRERQLTLSDEVLEVLDVQWQQGTPEKASILMDALRHCLELLSPAAMELIRKRYEQGMNYPAIAQLLKRPVNSLYVTFSRIHVSLADCISKYAAAGGDHD
ncbi:MAG: sigma-70 family RNA polymerase sigma factor [Phycisphaerales bacterium]|nr:sigma-70 family RNA polymerase sigma factor [Phycisphaerales bacterium]